MLTVLETLGPTERAVFVLREVFEVPYDEIAQAVGKSAATVRQIARRAREHVAARRLRVRVSPSEHQAVLERFLAAVRNGRLRELMDLLAPEVVLVADGGGLAPAARVPIRGAARVAKQLMVVNRMVTTLETTPRLLNGAPGVRMNANGGLGAMSLEVCDGRVIRIYIMRNPRKLARLDEPAPVAR